MQGRPEPSTRHSERPTVPPVAWLAAAAWAGATLGEDLVWLVAGGESVVARAAVAALLLLGALVLAGVLRRRTGRFGPAATALVLAVAGLVLGCGCSAAHGVACRARVSALADAGAREWTAVVTADPREGAFGPGMRVRVLGGPFAGTALSVWLPTGSTAPEYGRVVRFSAIAKPREHNDAGRRAARGGEHATANAWSVTDVGWCDGVPGALFAWRASAAERLKGVTGDPGALLRGVVLGDRRDLTGSAVDEDFRVLGLSHVVAVSGSHLAVVCGVVLAMGTRVQMRRRWLLGIVVAVASGYTVLTGMALSAVRSAIMLGVSSAGECLGVRRDGTSTLSLAVVALIVWTPWSVFDIGLALSVVAVAGLLVFGGLGIEWVAAAFAGRLPKVSSLLGGTLVAQACTLPIVVSAFGMLSLAAPLANLVVVPPAEVAICMGLAGAALGGIWAAGGALVVGCTGLVLKFVTAAAALLASMPGAAVSVGSPGAFALALGVAGCVALWARWPGPGSAAAARLGLAAVLVGSLIVGIGPRGPAGVEITVLDVGQGDAVLVRDGPRALLVDTGPNSGVMRQALARTGVRSLDAVVLTHDHDDHIGGFGGLSGVVRIGWVGLPETAGQGGFTAVRDVTPRLTPRGKVRTRLLHAGERWHVGRAEVVVLWPPAEPPEGLAANDTSVVLLVRCGGFSCVLTGDAEGAAQSGMAELRALQRVSVLKVPHHGSTNGLTGDALAAWRPADAVVSVGAGNDFGHPAPETLAMLRRSGSRIWRTDECGDVRIEVTTRGYRIVPAKRGGAARACATMEAPVRASAVQAPPVLAKEHDGRVESGSVAAGLPHLRQRGAFAAARGPPPA